MFRVRAGASIRHVRIHFVGGGLPKIPSTGASPPYHWFYLSAAGFPIGFLATLTVTPRLAARRVDLLKIQDAAWYSSAAYIVSEAIHLPGFIKGPAAVREDVIVAIGHGQVWA